jgi:hypothetical protein
LEDDLDANGIAADGEVAEAVFVRQCAFTTPNIVERQY